MAVQLLAALSDTAGDADREERRATIHRTRSAWLQTLSSMDHEEDDRPAPPGTRTRGAREPGRMSARMAWRAIQAGLPKDAIISSDIGNNCAIGNAYPTFEEGRKYLAPGLFGPCGYGFPSILGAKIGCPDVPVVGFAGDGAFGISMNEMTTCGREEWPSITMVIFRNYQWGAEKRNTTLWYDNNFVGTELNPSLSFAKVAEACGGEGGSRVETMEELTAALAESCAAQDRGRHHVHRGDPQPGARRALPPGRDEGPERRRRDRPRRHAAPVSAGLSDGGRLLRDFPRHGGG